MKKQVLRRIAEYNSATNSQPLQKRADVGCVSPSHMVRPCNVFTHKLYICTVCMFRLVYCFLQHTLLMIATSYEVRYRVMCNDTT